MRFISFFFSIVMFAIVALNGCSKDEKKVSDANAVTPVQQDQSPPLGVWVSGDQKIIVTKEKFGECKWLTKPPTEETQIEECNNYFQRLETKAELVKSINEFFVTKNKSIINDKEKSQEEINLSLSELKKEESEIQGILNQIIDVPLKIIAGYESESGDCGGYYFMDSANLYGHFDCQASGMGIQLIQYKKQQ